MPRRKKQSTPPTPLIPMPAPNPAEQNAKKWLWLLVGSFTIIIVVLWGWATKVSLSSINWSKTPEKQILDSRKNEWDTLFNDEASKAKSEQLKLQVKNIIGKIMAETNTSTSSTIDTATTSTPTSTINTSSTITNTTSQSTN